MTGRRSHSMERTGVPNRPETSSEVGASSSAGDSNVHRWLAGDDTPGPQGGEPGKPESRLAYGADDHSTLPSLLKLPEYSARLGRIRQEIPDKVEQTVAKIRDLRIELGDAPLSREQLREARQEVRLEAGRAKQELRAEIEWAERDVEVIRAELGQVQEKLPGEMTQALQAERVKLDDVLEGIGENLSKASPAEIREGLQQISAEQREELRQKSEASSQIIKEQKAELLKKGRELRKMQKAFDNGSQTKKARLEKELTTKRTRFEELSKLVQSLEQAERLTKGVMEPEQPSSPEHPEQGGRS